MLSELSTRESEQNPSQSLQTRFVLVSGPLGSGKTTVLNDILERHSDELGRVAVIVNDFGDSNIDLSRIKAEDVQGLAHECICCGSWKQFQKAIEELNGQFDTVLIEPTGVADPARLIQIAKDSGLDIRTLGIVDEKNLKRNRELGLQDNTTLFADAIIVTHGDPLSAPELSPEVARYVRELRGEGIDARSAKDRQVPQEILDRLLRDREIERGVSTEPIDPAVHAPGHSFTRLTVRLFEGLDFIRVEAALAGFKGSIERAKGRCGGIEFDWVHGEISQTGAATTGRPDEMIMISSDRGLNFTDFLDIGLPPLPGHSAIEECLSRYPDPFEVVRRAGVITPHFEEADVAYARFYPVRNVLEEIQHPEIREDLQSRWTKVLDGYLEYRLNIAELILDQTASQVDQRAAYLKRETGLILAWHMASYPDDISPSLASSITKVRPALLFFTGCGEARSVEDLGSHAELSDGVMAEIKDIAGFGLRTGETTKELIRDSLTNAASLQGADWPERKMQILLDFIDQI